MTPPAAPERIAPISDVHGTLTALGFGRPPVQKLTDHEWPVARA